MLSSGSRSGDCPFGERDILRVSGRFDPTRVSSTSPRGRISSA